MNSPKIGLLAYSSKTGLAYQTQSFYEHMKPAKVLIADISKFNGMPVDHGWCEMKVEHMQVTDGIPTNEECEWLVDGMDLIFVCETPLNYHLFEYARRKNVKTVNQYNYEFLEYFKNNALPVPDLLAAPTSWGIEAVRSLRLANVDRLPVPVDTEKINFREIDNLKTFVHVIGRPTANDRNGTVAFLKMAKIYHERDASLKFKVYLQPPVEYRAQLHFENVRDEIKWAKVIMGDSLEVIENIENNLDMYATGDLLVMPRKYGGLCLPMLEALASGMPVIMPDVSPNSDLLPTEWLTPSSAAGAFYTRTLINLFETNPRDLVGKIDPLFDEMPCSNGRASGIAVSNSWTILKGVYEQKLNELCNS